MTEQSQSTGHSDSFIMLTSCYNDEDMYFDDAEPIVLRTSMTFQDLKETLEVSFAQQADGIIVYWVGVHRGEDTVTAPTEITEENCSLLLRLLKQRGGLDQLALKPRVDSDEKMEKLEEMVNKITEENCSLLLRLLKQRGGLDQLALIPRVDFDEKLAKLEEMVNKLSANLEPAEGTSQRSRQ